MQQNQCRLNQREYLYDGGLTAGHFPALEIQQDLFVDLLLISRIKIQKDERIF